MYRLKKEELKRIATMFEGWEETMIWSCLQGYMGSAWADREREPRAAQIVVGDFCFFAGKPEPQLVQNIPLDFASETILMIPRDDSWSTYIERAYPEKCERLTRYAFHKYTEQFNRDHLRAYCDALPKGYHLCQIDEEIYRQAMENPWSKDLCSQFADSRDYDERGLGFAVLHDGMLVSGASSYTVFDKGLEIEIDTREDHQRKGLALCCAARLILECLDRGIYPSWDAANPASVALAQKLGYRLKGEYTTYAVTDFRQSKERG